MSKAELGSPAARDLLREPNPRHFFKARMVSALAGPQPLPSIAAAAFVAGVGGEPSSALWRTWLHAHVSPEAPSCVSAYDALGSIALAPLGEAIAAPLVEAIGSPATLWLGAAFIVVPTLGVLLVRDVRSLGPGS